MSEPKLQSASSWSAMYYGRRWPPPPPVSSILSTAPAWVTIPSDLWGVDEWRQYAFFLLKKGADLCSQLSLTEQKLFDARKKASRKPNGALAVPGARNGLPVTVLSTIKDRGKPGRPKDDSTRLRASEALKIKRELEAMHPDRRVTKLKALEELYRRQGKRISNARTDTATLKNMAARPKRD